VLPSAIVSEEGETTTVVGTEDCPCCTLTVAKQETCVFGAEEEDGEGTSAAAIRTPVPVRSAPTAVLVPAACTALLENDALIEPAPPTVPELNANELVPVDVMEPIVVMTERDGQATIEPSVALHFIERGTSACIAASIGLGDMLQADAAWVIVAAATVIEVEHEKGVPTGDAAIGLL
jgi:hypothetical protein